MDLVSLASWSLCNDNYLYHLTHTVLVEPGGTSTFWRVGQRRGLFLLDEFAGNSSDLYEYQYAVYGPTCIIRALRHITSFCSIKSLKPTGMMLLLARTRSTTLILSQFSQGLSG